MEIYKGVFFYGVVHYRFILCKVVMAAKTEVVALQGEPLGRFTVMAAAALVFYIRLMSKLDGGPGQCRIRLYLFIFSFFFGNGFFFFVPWHAVNKCEQ